jgi:serine/threonine protein kinase
MVKFASEHLVNGRYRLVDVIGRGGMGTVWRGHDEMLDREVAIKEVRLPADLDDEERAELSGLAVQEARATARLSNPGIITIFDVVDNDGAPVIVMEFIDGRSLAEILETEVRLPYRRVAEIGAALLEALREAHTAGVVHRDLKPANVLITDRRVVVTDFGVAQRVGEHTGEEVTGTPAFMAPEQAENAAASPAADLWALGATLFNAVEGRPPFEGRDYVTVLLTLLTQEAPAPRRAGPLAPLITALLRKDPERRPSSDEVAARLDAILEEKAGGTATAGPPAIAPPATEKPAAEKPASPQPEVVTRSAAAPKAERPAPSLRLAGPAHLSSGMRAGTSGTGARAPYHVPAKGPSSQQRFNRSIAGVAVAFVVILVLLAMSHANSPSFSSDSPTGLPSYPLDGLPRSPSESPSSPPDTSPEPTPRGFAATAISPDGGTVAFGGDSGTVRLYDTRSHRVRATLQTSSDADPAVEALAFSPDGRTIAVGHRSGGQVEVWNIADHRKRALTGSAEATTALRFGADGRTLAAAGDEGTVVTWTVRTSKLASGPFRLAGDGQCLTTALSPDADEAACATTDLNLVVWNIQNGKRITSLPVNGSTSGLAFAPNDRSLARAGDTGQADGHVELWNLTAGRPADDLPVALISTGAPPAFSPDGRTLAVPTYDPHTDKDVIEIWNIAGAKKVATLPNGDSVKAMDFSSDGRRLVAANDIHGGRLWDVRSRKRRASWTR